MHTKYAIHWGSIWHRSKSESKDFYRKYNTRTPFDGIRTPPFMPYEPFLLGVGVVYNLLRISPGASGALDLLNRSLRFAAIPGECLTVLTPLVLTPW